MTASEEELAFYRAVEDFFAAIRGVPHVLSPRDFQLLRSWWRDGVPLTAITSGVSEVVARRFDRGDDDPVVSLSYCRHAVARQVKRLAEMRTGQHADGAGAESPPPRRTPAALAADLRSAAAAIGTDMPAVERIILRIAREVEDGVDLPLAVLEERLYALESVLLAGCWRALPDQEEDRIQGASRAAAATSGATGKVLERTLRALRDRALRERLGLPRLELG